MDQYVYAIIQALNNYSIRMQYYKETNEDRFLNEANEWIEVASLYLKTVKL